MAGDREAALSAGCTGYIEKPINPDIFIDQLKQYLGR
jgi:two-component system cell cycle response regulator DivK